MVLQFYNLFQATLFNMKYISSYFLLLNKTSSKLLRILLYHMILLLSSKHYSSILYQAIYLFPYLLSDGLQAYALSLCKKIIFNIHYYPVIYHHNFDINHSLTTILSKSCHLLQQQLFYNRSHYKIGMLKSFMKLSSALATHQYQDIYSYTIPQIQLDDYIDYKGNNEHILEYVLLSKYVHYPAWYTFTIMYYMLSF